MAELKLPGRAKFMRALFEVIFDAERLLAAEQLVTDAEVENEYSGV